MATIAIFENPFSPIFAQNYNFNFERRRRSIIVTEFFSLL
jgi:hypothetical protein